MIKKILLLVAGLLAAGVVWLEWQLNSRPSVERYASDLVMAPADDDGLRVTFLGVSTLLFRDRTAAVMIDGFFSRPGLVRTAVLKISPDASRIDRALAMAGVDRLDAVITAHSHYDHAMDAADVAARTGAVVVGSLSTANIARGRGLPENRIHIVAATETMRFGDLTVTLVPSLHFPHGQAMGEIAAPLVPPARATDYLDGGSFSILIGNEDKVALVQASAGYVEGALAGRKADVAFLGIGLLGTKNDAYREAYWRETVTAVGARRVIPIHWDDFTRGLDEPLVPFPFLIDRVDVSMRFVLERATREGIDVRWPVVGMRTDPFPPAGPEAGSTREAARVSASRRN